MKRNKISSQKKGVLILDLDPEHDNRHQVGSMTYFIDKIYPLLPNKSTVIVNVTGLALLQYKRYGYKFNGYARFKKLIKKGRFILGNHTFLHRSFTGNFTKENPLKNKEIMQEINALQNFCKKEFGLYPDYFRAPYFDLNDNTTLLINKIFKYNLSKYINKKSIYKEKNIVKNNNSYIIKTNLILNKNCWKENIATPSEVDLTLLDNFIVSTHPYEFSPQCKTKKNTMKNFIILLKNKISFLNPKVLVKC